MTTQIIRNGGTVTIRVIDEDGEGGGGPLEPTGVEPGTYTNANVTIDEDGRITAAENGEAVSSIFNFGTNITADGVFSASNYDKLTRVTAAGVDVTFPAASGAPGKVIDLWFKGGAGTANGVAVQDNGRIIFLSDGGVWEQFKPYAEGSGGGYTDEQVRDVVAAMLVAGSNVTLTNNDVANTLTIASSGGGGGGGATNYKYRWMNVSATGENDILIIGEWDDLIDGVAVDKTGETYSSSAINPDADPVLEAAGKAFDGNAATGFTSSALPAWIARTRPTADRPTQFRIQGRTGQTGRMARNWTMRASNTLSDVGSTTLGVSLGTFSVGGNITDQTFDYDYEVGA